MKWIGLFAVFSASCAVDAGGGGLDSEPGFDAGPVECGDAVVDVGEECEPTSPNTDACRADCKIPTCGDGVASPGDVCLDDGASLFSLDSSDVVMTVADVDGDRRADLVMTRYDDSAGTLIEVAFGEVAGGFLRFSIPYDGFSGYPLAVGDLDGDGDMDIAVASADEIIVVRNDGSRTLEIEPAIEVRHGDPTDVAIADVNGDGEVEIVTLSEDDETLSIIPYPALPLGVDQRSVPIAAHSIEAGDFNGDDVADIVALSDDSLTFVFGSPNGELDTHIAPDVATRARRLGIADVNSDERLDVVFVDQHIEEQTQHTATRVLIARDDRETFDARDLAGVVARAVVDMDGDGRLDVVGLARADNRCATQYDCWHTETYLGLGDGSFASRSYMTQLTPEPGESLLGPDGVTPGTLVAGDFDGDGGVDLAATMTEGLLFARTVEVRLQRGVR